MNMKTKLIIGGAVLAAGATTYIVVKNAKKKKAERTNNNPQLSSANKSSEVLESKEEIKPDVDNNKEEMNNKENGSNNTKTIEEKPMDNNIEAKVVKEDNSDNENSEVGETVGVSEEVSENNNEKKVEEPSSSKEEKEQSTEIIDDSKGSDESSKNKIDINKLLINKFDKDGNERTPDDKLNDQEIMTIKAYAELIEGIKAEDEINKFIEQNSSFSKFETYNSKLLEHFTKNFVTDKRMNELEDVIKYIKESIILTHRENDITIFNKLCDLFNKLKNHKDIYFIYAQKVITDIAKELIRLRNIVDEYNEQHQDEEEPSNYENEEELIDSVLRARFEDDDNDRPVFGNIGLNINTGCNDNNSVSYDDDEEDEYLVNSAKKEFLINTHFKYDDDE